MLAKQEKDYGRIFFTRTGFGLKKKYHKEVIKKIKKLAKEEKRMAQEKGKPKKKSDA